jgi:hypothetical protein
LIAWVVEVLKEKIFKDCLKEIIEMIDERKREEMELLEMFCWLCFGCSSSHGISYLLILGRSRPLKRSYEADDFCAISFKSSWSS